MIKPIQITNEMKAVREKLIEKAIKETNKRIEYSISIGYNWAHFPVYADRGEFKTVYEEVKAIFTAQGYKIQPTGYRGGVWQITENIVW